MLPVEAVYAGLIVVHVNASLHKLILTRRDMRLVNFIASIAPTVVEVGVVIVISVLVTMPGVDVAAPDVDVADPVVDVPV